MPSSPPQELKVPVSFVYGKNDWMQPSAGQRVAAATVSARGRLSPYDCKVPPPIRSSVLCACPQAWLDGALLVNLLCVRCAHAPVS